MEELTRKIAGLAAKIFLNLFLNKCLTVGGFIFLKERRHKRPEVYLCFNSNTGNGRVREDRAVTSVAVQRQAVSRDWE